jgi:hypothetical protein
LVVCLLTNLCIFEKSKEFAKNTKGIEKQVLLLLNGFREKGKESFIKYKDILEIKKKCNAVTEVIQRYVGWETEDEYTPGRYIGLLGNREFNALWTGVSAGYDRLLGLTITEGRFFGKKEENKQVCVFTLSLAKSLNVKIQDTVKYMEKEFKIIGIVEEKNEFFDINVSPQSSGEVYLPIETIHQLFKSEGSPQASTYIRSNNIDLAYQQVIKLLESKYGNSEKFYLIIEDTSSSGLKFQEIFWTAGLLFMGSIFLLINKKSLSKFLLLTIGKNGKNQYETRNVLIKTCLLTLIGGILGIIVAKSIVSYLMIETKMRILFIVSSMLLVFSIEIIFTLLTIRKMTLMSLDIDKGEKC